MIGQNPMTKTVLISCTMSTAKSEICTRPEASFNANTEKLLMVPGSISTLKHGGHRDESLGYMLIEKGDQHEFPICESQDTRTIRL